MKILVVCQHFYPEQFRINDICFELAKKGHDVTVLTGLPNYPKGVILKEYRFFKNRKQNIQGVNIIRVPLIGRGKSVIRMGLNYLSFLISGSLKALFMKKDFDVVYVYQLSPITMAVPAIIVSKLGKIPLIIHCLDQWPISVTTGPISKNSFIYKILLSLSKKIYRSADLITTSSKSFKDYFENELGISAKSKGLLYLPSYAEDDYKNIKKKSDGKFNLVFAGNIGPAQSVETIIEAANILKNNKNIVFHIVGDGLSRGLCEEMSNKLKLDNVIFHGFHDVKEMPKFYSIADAFLITMVNNEVVNNTLPAKIQSYMLAGKPILGAVSGEVKTVIQDANCGLCCESLDSKGLAKNIAYAFKHQENIKTWSKNAKKYYDKYFDKKVCIDNLENVFNDIVKNK